MWGRKFYSFGVAWVAFIASVAPSAQARENWSCQPADVEELDIFVMSPAGYTSHFWRDENQVGLVDLGVAKFSDVRGYHSSPGHCEETLVHELNPADPVRVLTCSSKGAGFVNCRTPQNNITLTFIEDSNTAYVKDVCESRLRKYLVTQNFDGARTMISEQKKYQEDHQIFHGTAIDDAPALKFHTHDKTLVVNGFSRLTKGYSNFYHNYVLRLQCTRT